MPKCTLLQLANNLGAFHIAVQKEPCQVFFFSSGIKRCVFLLSFFKVLPWRQKFSSLLQPFGFLLLKQVIFTTFTTSCEKGQLFSFVGLLNCGEKKKLKDNTIERKDNQTQKKTILKSCFLFDFFKDGRKKPSTKTTSINIMYA